MNLWFPPMSWEALSPGTLRNETTGRSNSSLQNTEFFALETPYSAVVDLSNESGVKHNGNKPHNGNNYPRICRKLPLRNPSWEWELFQRNSTMGQRLLIAQYSAFGKYARLLELTAPINKMYARRWKHDFVILQGTLMTIPEDRNCPPPEERSRFNKIALLQMALNQTQRYDQLLILDADAMIYDFAYDLTGLLIATNSMLIAQRVHENDPPGTWNINNGVMLWNLHHPLTASVAEKWDMACRKGLPDNRPFRGDQFYLHKVLQQDETAQLAVFSVWKEFYYRDGTVVKHFQRSKMFTWNETGIDIRETRIQAAIDDICQRFKIPQGSLENRTYTDVAIERGE